MGLFFDSCSLVDFTEEFDHGRDGWRLAHQGTELSVLVLQYYI